MSSSPSLFLDCKKNISVNIFIPIQYFKHLNLISSDGCALIRLWHFELVSYWVELRGVHCYRSPTSEKPHGRWSTRGVVARVVRSAVIVLPV